MGYRSRLPIEVKKLLHYIEIQQQYIIQQHEEIHRLQTTIDQLSWSIDNMRSDEYLDMCNLKGTIRPIVWGDKSRLHISPKAAVFTCLFNVNSGAITVGDYTYAGSRVSILAGSHDMMLTGFLRRDAEITEGCDIHIGKGVWLGSNCTILGPATIGDNAVIAAGTVVTPGTVVECNSVYGGVPARLIKRLEFPENLDDIGNEHVKLALQRNGGVLCVHGWHEKESIDVDGKMTVVHRMIEDCATIYVTAENVRMYVDNPTEYEHKIVVQIMDTQNINLYPEDDNCDHRLEYTIASGKHDIEIHAGKKSYPRIAYIKADTSRQRVYIKQPQST